MRYRNSHLSIMHLSDIHRIKGAMISNDELLSALVSDSNNYCNTNPSIDPPDVIIVSGDIIQGITIVDSDYASELKRQYEEAFEFLSRLTNVFLSGDKSKLILVPGNHDVDWNTCFRSMEQVFIPPKDVAKTLFGNYNNYRWNWKDLSVYKVSNHSLYQRKLDHFTAFFQDFYHGCDLEYQIDPEFNYAIYPISSEIVIVGFNSCVGNDCFNTSGAISYEAVSKSHLILEEKYSEAKIRIAVWHHDFQGPPLRSDYMDRSVIELLIDKGFRLGFHGHQHKSETIPFFQYLRNEERMVIISAGSLTAGIKELPQGYNRQYNMIEIKENFADIRVHIREMLSNSSVFTEGRHTFLGGKSYADLRATIFTSNSILSTNRSGVFLTKIKEIEKFQSLGDYPEAIRLIEVYRLNNNDYIRRIKSDCLYRLQKWEDLIEHLPVPSNENELGIKLRALIKLKRYNDADSLVNDPQAEFDAGFLKECKIFINNERKIGGKNE